MLLPVIITVLILALGALSLVSMQIANTVALGQWARELSRGADLSTIQRQVELRKPTAALSAVSGDGMLCVRLSEGVSVPIWSVLIPRVEVSSCVPTP